MQTMQRGLGDFQATDHATGVFAHKAPAVGGQAHDPSRGAGHSRRAYFRTPMTNAAPIKKDRKAPANSSMNIGLDRPQDNPFHHAVFAGSGAAGWVAALCSRRFTVCSSFWTRAKRRSATFRVSAGMSTHSSQWKRVAGLPLMGYSNCLPQARQVRSRVAGWGLDTGGIYLIS